MILVIAYIAYFMQSQLKSSIDFTLVFHDCSLNFHFNVICIYRVVLIILVAFYLSLVGPIILQRILEAKLLQLPYLLFDLLRINSPLKDVYWIQRQLLLFFLLSMLDQDSFLVQFLQLLYTFWYLAERGLELGNFVSKV